MNRFRTRTATRHTPVKSEKAKPRPVLYLTEEEREGLRAASRFNASILDMVRQKIGPGMTTLELDRMVNEYTLDHGHRPACLGYRGYPRTICTSINEVVCHGIPDNTPLDEGDIINVDVTTIVDGWYGDSSETFLIGRSSPDAVRLVQVTFDAMHLGIAAAQPGVRLTDIGRAIERYVRSQGMEVVREYQGHGIGRDFHQEPGVPHYVPKMGASQEILRPGMCFTVEPMVNMGTWRTFVDSRDNWTVRTLDLSLSAQFEHTVLLTESGPEILTLTETGPQPGHKFG
ncbi:MAG: type I methionyl aminopeptidase [Planctomycetaceae bacterium]|nr:type I methionyl aminopeptidase [Planctomycetaceae bacterium]